MTRWYSGYVKKDGKVIYDVFEERSKIWDRIRRALRAKVQKDSLNMDDTILIHIQTVRSLTNNPTHLETPSLNRALDTYGNLNCLIDSGLKEIIKWCAKKYQR